MHTLHDQTDFIVGDIGRTEVLDGRRAFRDANLTDDALDGLLVVCRHEVIEGDLARVHVTGKMPNDRTQREASRLGDKVGFHAL